MPVKAGVITGKVLFRGLSLSFLLNSYPRFATCYSRLYKAQPELTRCIYDQMICQLQASFRVSCQETVGSPVSSFLKRWGEVLAFQTWPAACFRSVAGPQNLTKADPYSPPSAKKAQGEQEALRDGGGQTQKGGVNGCYGSPVELLAALLKGEHPNHSLETAGVWKCHTKKAAGQRASKSRFRPSASRGWLLPLTPDFLILLGCSSPTSTPESG